MRSVKAQTIWKTLDWVRLGENENVLPVQGTWQRWIQFKYLNHVLIEICRAWQLKPSPIQKQCTSHANVWHSQNSKIRFLSSKKSLKKCQATKQSNHAADCGPWLLADSVVMVVHVAMAADLLTERTFMLGCDMDSGTGAKDNGDTALIKGLAFIRVGSMAIRACCNMGEVGTWRAFSWIPVKHNFQLQISFT